MKKRLALLAATPALANCYGQIANGNDIEQTMNVTKHIVSQDTVGIIAGAVVMVALIFLVIVGLGSGAGRMQQ